MSKKQAVRESRPTYHLENDCRYIAIAVRYPYVYYFDGNGILRSDLFYNIMPWSLRNLFTSSWRAPKLVYNFVVGDVSSHKVLKKAADRMHEGDSVDKFFAYVQEEAIIHTRNKKLGKFIKRITEPTIKTKKNKDGSERFWSATLRVYINSRGKEDSVLYFTSTVNEITRIARKKLACCENFGRFNLDVDTLSCNVSYLEDFILVKFKDA